MINDKMYPLLIEDIFIQICHQIHNIKIIIKFEEISKFHAEIIRKNKWLNLPIRIRYNKNIILMRQTHNFSNLHLNNTCIANKGAKKLVNGHTLKLVNTKITDSSISKLTNVHTLHLSGTKEIYVCYANIYYFLNFYHL